MLVPSRVPFQDVISSAGILRPEGELRLLARGDRVLVKPHKASSWNSARRGVVKVARPVRTDDYNGPMPYCLVQISVLVWSLSEMICGTLLDVTTLCNNFSSYFTL